jgi:hypothetical protein
MTTSKTTAQQLAEIVRLYVPEDKIPAVLDDLAQVPGNNRRPAKWSRCLSSCCGHEDCVYLARGALTAGPFIRDVETADDG